MNIKNMKKRALQRQRIGIGESGRGQSVIECLGEGVCPDCRAEVLVAERPDEYGMAEFYVFCPGCGWECMVVGSVFGVPYE